MWERKALYNALRERIGSPPIDAVPNERLDGYLESAASYMASVLDSSVETLDPGIALVAGEYDYPLPPYCVQPLWVEWDEKYLTPSSVTKWVRENVDWRNATSGNPREFAVQSHRLLIYPPPDSAAVTEDGYLVLSFLAAPQGTDPSGMIGFADDDMWCLIHMAAAEFLGVNLDGTESAMARVQAARDEASRRLPELRKRRERSSFLEVKRLKFGRRRAYAAR